MKTIKSKPLTEEVVTAMKIVKQTNYKLTLPINKRLSHSFQTLCKELDTDASKQLRGYIEKCVTENKIKELYYK